MDGPLQLLILEDNPYDMEMVRRELHRAGIDFDANWAASKAAFLKMLDSGPTPDLMLADMSLPGFEGLVAMRLIRQKFPDIPVIIVSGVIGEETAIETLRAGATDYVLKERLARLGPVVRRAVHEARERAERKAAEEALRRERELFHSELRRNMEFLGTVINAVPLNIVTLAPPDYTFSLLNRTTEDSLHQLGHEHPVGRGLFELLPELQEQIRPILDEVVATLQPFHTHELPVTVLHKAERREIFLSLSLIPMVVEGKLTEILAVSQDMTSQVNARRAAERHAARDEAVMNSLKEGIIIQGPDGTIQEMNPAALRLSGFESSEKMLTRLSQYEEHFELAGVDNQKLPLKRWPLARLLEGADFTDYVVRVYHKDTAVTKYLSTSGTRVFDADGRHICNVITTRDITQLHKTTQEALDRKQILDAILERVPVGILVVKAPEMKIILQSAFDYKNFGYWIGEKAIEQAKAFNQRRVDTDEPVSIKSFPLNRAVCENTVIRDTEWHRRTIDGRQMVCLISASPLQAHDKRVQSAVQIYLDITERKRFEQALRQSEERLRLVLEGAAVGTWDWDIQTGELIWNERCKQLFDIPPETEMSYELFLAAIAPDDRERVDHAVKDALHNCHPYDVEMRVPWPDGSIHWIHSRGRANCNDAGIPMRMSGIAMDITTAKQAEAELARRAQELAMANQELEAFSYSVSHDLRGPLNIVGGFAEILLKYNLDQLDPPGRDYLRHIVLGVQKSRHIIEDLLSLSRVGRQEMSRAEVDLSGLVSEYLHVLQKAEPGRRAQLLVQPEVRVFADPKLIHLALENLLRNAWKFTSKQELTRIAFGTERMDGETVYFVKDNGAGFDMAAAEQLFQPFRRLHAEKEFAGTGVGLSIVARVIQRHGGRVWAEGAPGQGATFFFTLGGRMDH